MKRRIPLWWIILVGFISVLFISSVISILYVLGVIG